MISSIVVPLLLAVAQAGTIAPTVEAHELAARALARTPVSQAVYNNILKYATFSAASTIQPCRKPPFGSIVVREYSISSSDTQASLYKLASNKEFVLAFPGSASAQDDATDGAVYPDTATEVFPACSGCRLHQGFKNAFKSIYPSISSTLDTSFRANPDYTLTITGYSLGAALAKYAFVYYKISSTYGSKVNSGYSYGEPRNGNQEWANYVDSVSGASDSNAGTWYRVTHANDSIPQAPPQPPYQHSRTEYWERDDPFTGKPSVASTDRCYGQEPIDCNRSQNGDMSAHGRYPGLNDVMVCS